MRKKMVTEEDCFFVLILHPKLRNQVSHAVKVHAVQL